MCCDRGNTVIENDKSEFDKAVEMRQRAEEQLKAKMPEEGLRRTEHEMQRLLHELQVHQIELEMQNAELSQARDEVETALWKYNDLYDFAPVGYLTLDREGAIRAANLAGASLLGMERSLLLGCRLGKFIVDDARTAFKAFLEKVLTCRVKETLEVALLKGGKGTLFVQIEAVAAASGQECRAVIIDISVQRQSRMDLAAHAAELAVANADLEAFNFTVSHDLCTPLTTISGYCQVLNEICKDQLDEQSLGYLREVCEGTLRMKMLINSLLDFSRAARVKPSKESIDLSKMAETVAAGLMLTAPERCITFHITQAITRHGDAGLLRIVLDNLIGNAWKYTVNREDTVISFGVYEVAGNRACFVKDDGPGFDMAYADRLFAPFQRIPGIDVEGHGIGLATVERIVKRHGGRIWAESKPGEGATFFFTLE
jgi:signal transduction histidine kinase